MHACMSKFPLMASAAVLVKGFLGLATRTGCVAQVEGTGRRGVRTCRTLVVCLVPAYAHVIFRVRALLEV